MNVWFSYIKSSEMDHHLRALILHSFIQKINCTIIFFHPDCNCWSRSFTESADTEVSGRGLYRQWGITPRPEELMKFDVGNYSTYEMKNQVFLFFEIQTIMITWCWGQKLLTPLIPNCSALRAPAILKNIRNSLIFLWKMATYSCFWRVPRSKILLQASLRRTSDLLTLVS